MSDNGKTSPPQQGGVFFFIKNSCKNLHNLQKVHTFGASFNLVITYNHVIQKDPTHHRRQPNRPTLSIL